MSPRSLRGHRWGVAVGLAVHLQGGWAQRSLEPPPPPARDGDSDQLIKGDPSILSLTPEALPCVGAGVVVGEQSRPEKRLCCSKHFKAAECHGVRDGVRGRPEGRGPRGSPAMWLWASPDPSRAVWSPAPPPAGVCSLRDRGGDGSPAPRKVTSTANLKTARHAAGLTRQSTPQAPRSCVRPVEGWEEVRGPRAPSGPRCLPPPPPPTALSAAPRPGLSAWDSGRSFLSLLSLRGNTKDCQRPLFTRMSTYLKN